MTYHFKECGLDNVYLKNGYNIVETPYGEAISIEGVRELHLAIGRSIIDQNSAINGAELRFLRKEMELTQSALAGIMGESEQNVARWEKSRDKPVRGSIDRLARILYNDYVNGDGSARRLIDKIAHLDALCAKIDINLCATSDGWKYEPIAA